MEFRVTYQMVRCK